MQPKFTKIAKISKALADENRLRIFRLIAEQREITCKDIVATFPLSQPTISHHLKVLLNSGLIKCRKAGQWSLFYLNSDVLNDFLAFLTNTITEEL